MSRVLVRRPLTPHPDTPAGNFSVIAKVSHSGPGLLEFEFVVNGPVGELALPAMGAGERTDGLWKTTCFEAFLMAPDGETYLELNMSPSRRWAAYDFDAYRHGMANAADVSIEVRHGTPDESRLDVTGLASSRRFAELGGTSLGLSAILDHGDGNKSFWALAHPEGQPDFHHAACFAATIPATGEA